MATLTNLSQHKEWWVRLYAVEIMRQHPEFRKSEIVERLKKDEHPLVREELDYIKELLELVENPLKPHATMEFSYTISTLFRSYQLDVPEKDEIKNGLLEIFKNKRKQLTLDNQIALAKAVISTGNKAFIRGDLLSLKDEIEDKEPLSKKILESFLIAIGLGLLYLIAKEINIIPDIILPAI